MRKARQSSPVIITHDPLGLLALPVASIDCNRPQGSQLGPNAKLFDAEEGLVMANAAMTIGAALVAVLIVVGLVVPPGPAKDSQIVAHCHLQGG